MSTDTYATPTSGGAAAVGSASTVGARPARRVVPAPPRPRREDRIPLDVQASAPPRVQVGPEPRLRQLVGVCVWAAVIGGVALVTAIRGLIGSLGSNPPGWYEPSVISVGLAGLALTVGAFVSVNRRWIPFALLGGSTVLVIVALNLTARAF